MRLFVLALCVCAVVGSDDTSQRLLDLEEKVAELLELREEVDVIKADVTRLERTGANSFASFSVALRNSQASLSSGDKVPYDTVITNVGNAYSVSAREFVAPNPGVYVFAISSTTPNSSSCHLLVHKNNDSGNFEAFGSKNNYLRTGANVGVLSLNAGDKVTVKSIYNSCTLDGTTYKVNSFSGFQVA